MANDGNSNHEHSIAAKAIKDFNAKHGETLRAHRAGEAIHPSHVSSYEQARGNLKIPSGFDARLVPPPINPISQMKGKNKAAGSSLTPKENVIDYSKMGKPKLPAERTLTYGRDGNITETVAPHAPDFGKMQKPKEVKPMGQKPLLPSLKQSEMKKSRSIGGLKTSFLKKSISAQALELGQYKGEKLQPEHHNRIANEYRAMAKKAYHLGDKESSKQFFAKAEDHQGQAGTNEMEKSAKPGLYANIRKRREKGLAPKKPGDKGYPTEDAFKQSAKSQMLKKGDVVSLGAKLKSKMAKKDPEVQSQLEGVKQAGAKIKQLTGNNFDYDSPTGEKIKAKMGGLSFEQQKANRLKTKQENNQKAIEVSGVGSSQQATPSDVEKPIHVHEHWDDFEGRPIVHAYLKTHPSHDTLQGMHRELSAHPTDNEGFATDEARNHMEEAQQNGFRHVLFSIKNTPHEAVKELHSNHPGEANLKEATAKRIAQMKPIKEQNMGMIKQAMDKAPKPDTSLEAQQGRKELLTGLASKLRGQTK